MKYKILRITLYSLLVEIFIFIPLIISIIIYETLLKSNMPNKNLFYAFTLLGLFLVLFIVTMFKKDKFNIVFKESRRRIFAFILIIILAAIGIIVVLLSKVKM